MPDSFLRYRFDGSDPIRRHFHVVDGRALFFYPATAAALQQGGRVAIEFAFTTSDQRCCYHGVAGLVSEEPAGVWLQLHDPQVIEGLELARRYGDTI